jgi:acetyl-CoA acetyltransferase
MREVVNVAGVRTAVEVFGGGFKNYSVVDLGATVI